MIHNIITSIAAKTNQYIKNKLSIDDDIVIVRSLVDIKGNLSQGIENKIVVFLKTCKSGLNNEHIHFEK